MTEPSTFKLAVADSGVATLTLDRPDILNALSFETYRELRDAAGALAQDASVKAVVLTGSGRGFCSGGNVQEIIGALVHSDVPQLLAFARLTSDTVLALRQLGKPIIAAVNGIAVGAGAALALAADLRIATPDAGIGFVFPRVGLSAADMGVTWLLPRVVGLGRAAELLYTGDVIDATTAERWGLYNWVVPSDRLIDDAIAFAERIAAGPTFAHGVTKQMLDRSAALDLPSALHAEAYAQQACMRTADFREAYQAFVDARPPRFTGK